MSIMEFVVISTLNREILTGFFKEEQSSRSDDVKIHRFDSNKKKKKIAPIPKYFFCRKTPKIVLSR